MFQIRFELLEDFNDHIKSSYSFITKIMGKDELSLSQIHQQVRYLIFFTYKKCKKNKKIMKYFEIVLKKSKKV